MNAIYISVYTFVVGLAAILLVLGLGILFSVFKKTGLKLLPWFFPLIGLTIVLIKILSFRNVDTFMLAATTSSLDESFNNSFLVTNILRASTYLMVGYSFAFIVSYFYNKTSSVLEAQALYLSFIAYFIGGFVLNAVFGLYPDFDYKLIFSVLIVSALYFGQDIHSDKLISFIKQTLLITVVLSLIAAILFPRMAIQHNYNSWVLPWLSIRLWGVSSHANSLGPIATYLILIELCYPTKSKIWHALIIFITFLTLILSQSKTAWVCLILALIVYFMFYLFRKKDNKNYKADLMPFIFITSITSLFLFALVVLSFSSISILDAFMGFLVENKLDGMTGRDVIWKLTLSEWHKNILFGYGPKLWGAEYSAKYHLLGIASNGHNQLVNSLGKSGLVGLFTSVVYFGVLVKYSILSIRNNGPLAVCLLLALFVRGISEVPFSLNLMSEDFLIHLFLLGYLFTTAKNNRYGEKSNKIIFNTKPK